MPASYLVPKTQLTHSFVARVPGSKSITNRALIAAALCDAPVTLQGPLRSEDTEVASQALRSFGVRIDDTSSDWIVDGQHFAPPNHDHAIYLANAGTAVRFLSAVLCAKGWSCRVHGTDRMHQRPIGPLIQGLQDLGGQIISENNDNCPPLLIGSTGLRGGRTSISGQVSSQFFSGLMMAAPFAQSPCEICVSDTWLSLPYIEMTAAMLNDFGIEANLDPSGSIHIEAPQSYRSPGLYPIEPDATAATYPMGLALIHGVGTEISNLHLDALQGDVAVVETLRSMGALVDSTHHGLRVQSGQKPLCAIEANLNHIPDAAMTVVVLCSIAQGKSRLTGLKNLAYKECNRLEALGTELNKLGAKVQWSEDGFLIEGVPIDQLHGADIETYHDHRMAMCLSLLGTRIDNVRILDPDCVQKTYPNYWDHLHTWIQEGLAP